eukprot:TRINITY_DN921_c0_g1_i3.p1 TRINITY_DN921_c0_g1~~TRINITY_DN921_c0_g1_i3.p1  ORF type:complete len:196 (+),score=48.25 TRINITY_DN921_c0_g1_i3:108-695(+)
MIRRPPRSTLSSSSAASDVYKRQVSTQSTGTFIESMWGPDDLLAYAWNHPMLVLVILFLLYQRWKAKQPFPDVAGAKTVSIKSMDHWKQIQNDASASGEGVLVDFYATWCPPCRTAAPIFGAMSKEYSETAVIFAKCDVDTCSDVSKLAGIQAMPTFQLWKQGNKLQEVQGWSENKVRVMLAEEKIGFNTVTKSE